MKKLYRSRDDAMVGGVCGGLGHYLEIDATIVRLAFVFLTIFGHMLGPLLYLVLLIFMPLSPMPAEDTAAQAEREAAPRANRERMGPIIGGTLVFLGLALLLHNLRPAWLWWLSITKLWPLLLIAGGVALLLSQMKGE